MSTPETITPAQRIGSSFEKMAFPHRNESYRQIASAAALGVGARRDTERFLHEGRRVDSARQAQTRRLRGIKSPPSLCGGATASDAVKRLHVDARQKNLRQ